MNLKRALGGIGAGLKAAASAFSNDGCHYKIGGRRLLCPLCSNDTFDQRPMLMNTTGMSFMNLDWLNESACALVCRSCSRIEIFMKAPDRDD
jgi:hypothetical protein